MKSEGTVPHVGAKWSGSLTVLAYAASRHLKWSCHDVANMDYGLPLVSCLGPYFLHCVTGLDRHRRRLIKITFFCIFTRYTLPVLFSS